jgi:uncharacterized protein (DUF1778 family)
MKHKAHTVQISARISSSTQERVDRFARARGLKKSHLIEQALLHHIEALEALPEYAVIPKRIVLGDHGWDEVTHRLEHPRPPTSKLEKLMSGD